MYCSHCSNPVRPGIRFCSRCGTEVGQVLARNVTPQAYQGATIHQSNFPATIPVHPQPSSPAALPNPVYGSSAYQPQAAPAYGPPAYQQFQPNQQVYAAAQQPYAAPYAQGVQVNVYQNAPAAGKSVAVALLLTFFFGPIGMFYSTPVGGLVMSLISIILLFTTLGLGWAISWPICMVWAAVAASNSR